MTGLRCFRRAGRNDLTGAVESSAGLNHQIHDMHVSLNATAGDDLQARRRNGAVYATADHDGSGLNLAFHLAVFADHHV